MKESYERLTKGELIERLKRLEGTVQDLRSDNESLFRTNKRYMSEIVERRRQIEALQIELEGKKKNAKKHKTEEIRV